MTQISAEKLLELVGIEYSRKEHQRLAVARWFNMLGGRVTFPQSIVENKVEAGNAENRKAEIQSVIKEVSSKGKLMLAETSSISGRIGLLSSQVWLWSGEMLVNELRDRSNRSLKDSGPTLNEPVERDVQLIASLGLIDLMECPSGSSARGLIKSCRYGLGPRNRDKGPTV